MKKKKCTYEYIMKNKFKKMKNELNLFINAKISRFSFLFLESDCLEF